MMCETAANCSTAQLQQNIDENCNVDTKQSGKIEQPAADHTEDQENGKRSCRELCNENIGNIVKSTCNHHNPNLYFHYNPAGCRSLRRMENSCCQNHCAMTAATQEYARPPTQPLVTGDLPDVNTSAFCETESIASSCSAATRRSLQDGCYFGGMRNCLPAANDHNWQLFSVSLRRANPEGFGIAVIGGRDNPHCFNDNSIIVSDVISSGPAFGLLQVNDRIISANGLSFEYVDYATAISVMRDAEQLNMIVKRRIPLPFVEYEQRTLKFTLSKSHKKDDFGIVLGCRYYIKEITNPKLAEKDPGLKEGDTVLRVNGQSLEALSLEEATRLLHRSREKLSLVVQRDVRRTPGSNSRWPSQTTVYERLGSVSATPRQSPTPVHYTHSANHTDGMSISASPHSRKLSDLSPGPKRFSDSVLSAAPQTTYLGHPSPLPPYNQRMALQNNGQSNNNADRCNAQSANSNSQYPLQQNVHSPHLSNRPSQSLPKNYQQSVCGPAQQQQVVMQMNAQCKQQQSTPQTPAQLMPVSQTPTSSIMSTSSIMERASPHPSSMQCATQQEQLTGNSNYNSHANEYSPNPLHNSQHSCSSSYQHQTQPHSTNSYLSRDGLQPNPMARSEIRILTFYKGNGSLGIRVIGGNQVGIYVSVVQDKSPAANNGIKVGDRIHVVNNFNMNGVTREEAVEYLLSLGENVTMHVEHSFADDFSHVKSDQMGDNFYIRTHFQYQKRSSRQELNFNEGDIFHVTDTLAGGSPGYWQVTKVYSANETEIKSNEASGIIPNSKTAEILAKQSRVDSSTIGRSIFRRKLQTSRTKSLTNTMEEASDTLQVPAYERVSLKKPAFHRPIVLYGPLADVARELLLEKYPHQFGAVSSPSDVVKAADASGDTSPLGPALHMSSIDAVMAAQRHCVLSISPASVERLQLAQYAPIVILIDVDSRTRIRELRSKAGATTSSGRRLMEHVAKIKRQHSHLLTATLDASKEDGWFEALRHLIFHLQERRVWMPEVQLARQSLDDILLFPLQCSLTDMQESESSKARMFSSAKNDSSIYDATTSSGLPVKGMPNSMIQRKLPNGSSGNSATMNASLAANMSDDLRAGYDSTAYSSYPSDFGGFAASYQQCQPNNNKVQKPPTYASSYTTNDTANSSDYCGSLRRPTSSSSNSTYATNNAAASNGGVLNGGQQLNRIEPLSRRNIGYVNTTIPQARSPADISSDEKNGTRSEVRQPNSNATVNHYDISENIADDPILKHYLPGMMSSQCDTSSKLGETKLLNNKNESSAGDTATVNANFSLRRTAQSPKSPLKNGANHI